jgi:hypothetical protein
MDGFDRLRQTLHAVRVAHHLPGRIRLKLEADPVGLPVPAAADLNRFQDLLGKVEGVRDLRINLMARSCTVEYDPKIIPFDAWGDFLAGKPSAAAQVLEGILRRKYQEVVDGKP